MQYIYKLPGICMLPTLRSHIAIIILFALAVTVGLFIYADYGMSWDEVSQWNIGRISYEYVFHGSHELFTSKDKDYGVGFELPLYMLERALHLTDTREVFLLRHLVTHLFFLTCMLAGYILAWKLFRSRLLACLVYLVLVCHPRIYAHSFFNTKDIPFLCFFLLSLLAIYVMFRRQRASWFLLGGLLLGYTINLRVMGVLLLGMVGLFLLIDMVQARREGKPVGKYFGYFGLYAGGAVLMLYASWPYLWTAPVTHFVANFQSFSHYRWQGEVLFMGRVIKATSLPWYYLPVWIGITTPLMWLFFALWGVATLARSLVRRPADYLANTPERNLVLYLCSFLAPVLAVIVLHSVVYDDWRHLYFIYPPLVLLMAYGVHRLDVRMKGTWARAFLAGQLAGMAFTLSEEHPYQQVYFNNLASHKEGSLKKKYEMEYWGCSYKDGLEWLAANTTDTPIRVLTIKPLSDNLLLLPASQRTRFVEVAEGDFPFYLVTNYRFAYRDSFHYPLVHRFNSGNSPVLDIYKVEK